MTEELPGLHLDPWERDRTDRRVGVITTTGQDGYPHAAPVGVWWEDGNLRFETNSNSVKLRNLEENPRVAILVYGKPKWGVLIQGRAQVISKGEGSEQAQIRVLPERKASWKRKED